LVQAKPADAGATAVQTCVAHISDLTAQPCNRF